MTDTLLQWGAIAGASLALLAAGRLVVKAACRTVKRVRAVLDLVHHELQPNSGSSIKDEQKHQIVLLRQIQGDMAEDRRQTAEWQQGVMMTLGNHEGRIDRLEK